jgi:hypothetical protein
MLIGELPCRDVANVYSEGIKASVSFSDLQPALCFHRTFHCWHAICEQKCIMPKVELHNQHRSVEPAPRFASDAEIAFAEQLRHQLEERLLGPSAAPSSLLERSDKDH